MNSIFGIYRPWHVDGSNCQSTVKYREATEPSDKFPDFARLDLPDFGASAPISLQVRVWDSLESQAVILHADMGTIIGGKRKLGG